MSAELSFESLDLANINQNFSDDLQGAGALVTFTGFVRDFNGSGGLDGLELEHYPGMTEASLNTLIEQAKSKFNCLSVHIVHRVGKVENHEPIVWVGAASHHRKDAFDCAMFTMDYLKQSVPLWKKEWQNGTSTWVEAKVSDKNSANKWAADEK